MDLGYDPIEALKRRNKGSIPIGRSPIEDALVIVSREGVGRLKALLHSKNEYAISGALHVFSELPTNLSIELVPDVLPLLRGSTGYNKLHILEGLIPNINHISNSNLGDIVIDISHPESYIRRKAVELISIASTGRVRDAITEIKDCAIRKDHLSAFLKSSSYTSDEEISQALRRGTLLDRSYAFIFLMREARGGHEHEISSEISDDDTIFFRAKVALTLRNWARRKSALGKVVGQNKS